MMDAEQLNEGSTTTTTSMREISSLPPEILQHIFKVLGPVDLKTCQQVSTIWRKEAEFRAKSLKEYKVESEEDLKIGIALLKAPNPKFELKELELDDLQDYHESPLLMEFINCIPRISLGVLVIGRYEQAIKKNQIMEILRLFPNVLEFELKGYGIDGNDNDDFDLLHYQNNSGTSQDSFFPNLRILALEWIAYSIGEILQACPNLKSLDLERLNHLPISEQIDMSKLQQLIIRTIDLSSLEELNAVKLKMRLRCFCIISMKIGVEGDPWEAAQRIISALQEFLKSQSATLTDLDLRMELVCHSLTVGLHLFPLCFPILTKLNIDMRFGSDLREVLSNTPQLKHLEVHEDCCMLHLMNEDEDELDSVCGKGATISKLIPTGFLKEYPNIEELVIYSSYVVEPQDLSMFGYSFKNLTSLNLDRAVHGLLYVVFSELTRLTELMISREAYDIKTADALRDSDFIWTSPLDPNRLYIGNMKNLKRLEITLGFHKEEVSPPDTRFTDDLLDYGIFDIVSQLDILKIRGIKFSDEAVRKLFIYMKKCPGEDGGDPEKGFYHLVKNDSEISN